MVRVRTEEKRNEIIEVATELFQELGYEHTSMSEISRRLGGSKATLYGYFRSKDELLLAALYSQVNPRSDELLNMLLGAPNLREGLTQLGAGYLAERLSIRPTRFFRIISTRPESSGIGRDFYQQVIYPNWMRLCRRLEWLMDEGKLRRADPWIATVQFKGLLDTDLVDQRLLGARTEVDMATIRKTAEAAIDTFLRAYGIEADCPGATPGDSRSAKRANLAGKAKKAKSA